VPKIINSNKNFLKFYYSLQTEMIKGRFVDKSTKSPSFLYVTGFVYFFQRKDT